MAKNPSLFVARVRIDYQLNNGAALLRVQAFGAWEVNLTPSELARARQTEDAIGDDVALDLV